MRIPLLLLASLITTRAQTVERYRCYVDWYKVYGVPIRHVGIEVETTNLNHYFIENLGSGTTVKPQILPPPHKIFSMDIYSRSMLVFNGKHVSVM